MRNGDLSRKALHAFLSLTAAGVVLALDPVSAAVVLAAATMGALSVELARRVSRAGAAAFERIAGLLKPRERAGLTGATLLSIGYTLTAVLFPGTPTLAGILLAGLADPAAAVLGKRFGVLRYPGGKSVGGSGAFLAVALAIGLMLGLRPGPALVAAATLTVLEALALPVDDNLYLPVAGAATVEVIQWVAGA